MAHNEIDPSELVDHFEDHEIAMGRYIPTSDGKIRTVSPSHRRKVTLAGARHNARGPDKMTMSMLKADMAALWRDGQTYEKIAEQVSDKWGLEGVERYTANTIHYHIKQMLSYWRQLGAARVDERQAMLLARLDQVEQLAIEAYFNSMEGRSTRTINKQIERAQSKAREKQLLDAEHRNRSKYNVSLKTEHKYPLAIRDKDTKDILRIHAKKTQKMERLEENFPGDPKFLNIIFNIQKERAKILGIYARPQDNNPDTDAAKLTDEQREQRLAEIISQAKTRKSRGSNTMLADPAPLGGFPEVTSPSVPEIEDPDEDDWGINETDVPEIEDDTEWE